MTKYAQPDNIVTAIFEQHTNGVSGRQIAKNLDISIDESRKYILFIKEKKCLNIQDLIANIEQFNQVKNQEFNIKTYSIEQQEEAYAYLLGMYLGDGYISQVSRTYALRIALDYSYPKIIQRVRDAMLICFPKNKITSFTSYFNEKPSCTELKIYNNDIPKKFPQHGKGKKHERSIVLEQWQQIIVEKYAKQFLRGLFESDGSRYISRIKKKNPEEYYEYVNYSFTNVSIDITNLVINHLKKLNINYKLQHKYKNKEEKHQKQYVITISKKANVAFMDTFIGPKE